jgi:hypothetical protein
MDGLAASVLNFALTFGIGNREPEPCISEAAEVRQVIRLFKCIVRQAFDNSKMRFSGCHRPCNESECS